MKLRVLLALVWGASAHAAVPRCELHLVNPDSREFTATCAEFPDLKIPLYEASPPIKVMELREVPASKDLVLLIYEAGVIGTKALYRVEQAVLIDRRQKKVLGQARWRFEPTGKGDSEPLGQPEWKWGDHVVTVTLPDSGRIQKISW